MEIYDVNEKCVSMSDNSVNVLSLFDGMACGMLAMLKAGVKVKNYYAYEIEKNAIKAATHNFPDIKELGDVFDEDYTKYEGIDYLIGGSPCFTKGHYILTDNGYKDVSEIQVGDMVLTHKGRYRKVIRTNKCEADIVDVNIMGYPTFHTTAEHPFYTLEQRKATRSEYNKLKSWRIFSMKPEWTKALELKPKVHFCGQHIGNSADINEYNIDTELAYILGRYVADGHIRKSKRFGRENSYQYQVILSIGADKVEQFRKNVTHRHYSFYKHTQNVYRVCFSSMELLNFIEQQGFGKSTNNKTIPEFIFSLPRDVQLAFLSGYIDGDGHIGEYQYCATTVSPKLAFGLQRLVTQLYSVNVGVAISSNERPHKIGDREIHSNYPLYTIIWKENIKKQSVAHIQDGIVWTQVKNVCKAVRSDVVYNIEVDEDNSYTVNNIIVHNCTYWSIAQSPNKRETTSSGLGWDLFSQYVRAIKEAKPKYFIYENNKSMAKAIYEAISKEFGFEPIMINSALVSAQNRQRYYWVGKRNVDGTYSKIDVEQPEDKGILLKEVLDSAVRFSHKTGISNAKDKALAICASDWRGINRNQMQNAVVKPLAFSMVGDLDNRRVGTKDKAYCLAANPSSDMSPRCIEPVNTTVDGKAQCIRATIYKDSIRNLVANAVDRRTAVAEPVGCVQVGGGGAGGKTGLYAMPITPTKVGEIGNGGQGNRIYDIDSKAVTQQASSGGLGSNTGAYAIPVDNPKYELLGEPLDYCGYAEACEWDNDGKPIKAISYSDGKKYTAYEVVDGEITIKEKQYPIKLIDGYYIIRKLTISECKRLQTVPEWYEFPISNTQAYKCLGNGWTIDVIAHLINATRK